MKIEIDTKEDIHILRHIVHMLNAISSGIGQKRYDSDFSANSLLNDSSNPSPSTAPVSDASGLMGMFDSGSSSSSSAPFSMFDEPKKEDTNKRDFIDSLQVY